MDNPNLFGFRIGTPDERKKGEQSFVSKPNEDAAITVHSTYGGSMGEHYGISSGVDKSTKNEEKLITKYRNMAAMPECERAIDDIVNESIIISENKEPVTIVLDNLENVSNDIKETIRDEFTEVLNLFKFNTRGYDIFKNWYVDGRLFYHIIIDRNNPRKGISELRYIDPRTIKKMRVEKKTQDKHRQGTHNILAKEYNEYFLHSEKGIGSGKKASRVAPDAIAHCHSGLMNDQNTVILSYLDKAIKPFNQLRSLEDATVIYRLARAPERRIFYIDVGNLPNAKAEQHLQSQVNKHKNKYVYDPNTGDVKDERRHMAVTEDYWLPRREGGKGTEIDTLPGGTNLGEIEDILYFRKKLYEALNVPISRLESDASYDLGRTSEITRDEVKFTRFVNRLRNRFSELFHIVLERQLLLKSVMTKKEWAVIKGEIFYDFLDNNHFTELKEAEILENRLQTLGNLDEYIGKYFSMDWARKNVLMMSEDEIKEMDKKMKEEAKELAAMEAGDEDDDGDDGDEKPNPKPKEKDDKPPSGQ